MDTKRALGILILEFIVNIHIYHEVITLIITKFTKDNKQIILKSNVSVV